MPARKSPVAPPAASPAESSAESSDGSPVGYPTAPSLARWRRDPEGRRAAIISAATELICESGLAALTHRAVATRAGVAVGSTTQYFTSIDDLRTAALQSLADEMDQELVELAAIANRVDHNDPTAAITTCGEIIHDFLCDTRQVHASLAMMGTATTDASLRTIALQWSDQLTDIFSSLVGYDRALAAVAYIDGLTVHAALHDTPVSKAAITTSLTALLRAPTVPDMPAAPDIPKDTP